MMPDRSAPARAHTGLCAGRVPTPRHEDAEGVAVGVGVDVEPLRRVVGAIEQEVCTEMQCPLVLLRQGLLVGDREVEVRLLRRLGVGPRRAREVGHLLERETWLPGRSDEDEPVPTLRVVLPGRRRLVAGLVRVAQELPVELGQGTGVGRVEHERAQRRERRIGHGRAGLIGRLILLTITLAVPEGTSHVSEGTSHVPEGALW